VALDEMAGQAKRLGANAIVGIDLNYEVIREGMLMVLKCIGDVASNGQKSFACC